VLVSIAARRRTERERGFAVGEDFTGRILILGISLCGDSAYLTPLLDALALRLLAAQAIFSNPKKNATSAQV
jgi:hypothetical protein